MTDKYIYSMIMDDIPLLSSKNVLMQLNNKAYAYSGMEMQSGNFLKDSWYVANDCFKSVVNSLKGPVKIVAASLTIGYEGFKLLNMKFANKSAVIYSGNELLKEYFIDEIKSSFAIASSSYTLKANLADSEEKECNVGSYSRLEEDQYSEVDSGYSYDNQAIYDAF